jgi:hypothetical protein
MKSRCKKLAQSKNTKYISLRVWKLAKKKKNLGFGKGYMLACHITSYSCPFGGNK